MAKDDHQTATRTKARGLSAALSRIADRRLAMDRGGRFVVALALWIVTWLALVVVDAGWPLPMSVRIAGLIVLAVGLIVCIWYARPRRLAGSVTNDALTAERELELNDNRLVNAVLLAQGSSSDDQQQAAMLHRELSRRAIDRGEQYGPKIDPQRVVDTSSWQRSSAILATAALVMLLVTMIHPRLVGVGTARLVLPWMDIPHFSLTRLAVEVDEDSPQVGKSVRVSVQTQGLTPDHAMLVPVDDRGRSQRAVRMVAVGDGRFERTLVGVRESMSFVLRAGHARSAVYRITPVEPDAPEKNPGDKPTDKPQDSDNAQPKDGADRDGMSPADQSGELSNAYPELAAGVERLMAQLDEISSEAQKIAEDASLSPAERAKRIADLERQMEQLRQNANQLADLAEQLSRTATPKLSQTLKQLAKELRSLGVCELGNCPGGDKPSTKPGQGNAPGAGGGNGPVQGWLSQVAMSAGEDGRQVASLLSQFMSGIGGDQPPPPDAPKVPRQTDPIDTSRQSDTLDHQMQDVNRGDVRLDHAPPAYRDLVADYYTALGHIERAKQESSE